MELEFQISEVFPSLIIKNNLDEYITETIIKKVDNIIENMTDKIPLSEAVTSKKKINNVIDLSKFEKLKDYLINGIIKYTKQLYQIETLDIAESFVVQIPENGHFELRKQHNSSFHILINLSASTEIVLQNPIYLVKSLEYQVEESNKYNSQYSFSVLNQNESIIIPSGIYYGFPKREKELKLISIILR